MKICFFGIYDPAYSRNAIILRGLREAGAEVIECQADWRDPNRYRKLWKSLRELNNEYDFIYAAYPSPVPTILAKILSNRPVISDAFYSMFDSVVNDRRKYSRWSLIALKLLILDWLGVLFADLVISDTNEHKKYWATWWGIGSNKIRTLYLGIDDKYFHPLPSVPHQGMLVHFHGTYIPLQGPRKIVEAANLCKSSSGIRFRMIGSGRELRKSQELANNYSLSNIEFITEHQSLGALNDYMAEADIILGIFGDTEKAVRVIPNKVYEGIAAEKAVITMDSPAIREIFSEDELKLIESDAESLARAIRELSNDAEKRNELAGNGHAKALMYRPQNIGSSLISIIKEYFSNHV